MESCYDCSGYTGYPSALGDDNVLYQSSSLRSGLFNQPCADCSNICAANLPVNAYQFYYTSQSHYLRLKLEKSRYSSTTCGSYTPGYDEWARRETVCTQTCAVNTKNKVSTMPKFGGGISPHKGAVTQKEFLRRMKDRQATTVRGQQMTSSTFLLSQRPRGCVTGACRGPGINKNTAATMNAMHKYPPRAVVQNQAVALPCCTTAPVNVPTGNNLPSIPKNVIVCRTCPV